jgi:hypothetical protein
LDIINLWWHKYFPLAREVGAALEKNATSPFSPLLHFTAQSWLVSLFLDCPPSFAKQGVICPNATEIANFKEAAGKGWITWHAFPFNGEPELMDPSLFSFGISMTHGLDDLLGQKRKIVMSQRDVPGLTRSVIPLLVKNGVRAVSVGVNGGSAAPNLPPAFIWRHGVDSVLAMWLPGGYGGLPLPGNSFAYTQIPGSSQVLVVAWRGDNAGPAEVKEVLSDWEKLQKQFPGANILASTFDNFVESVLGDAEKNLPVVDSEVADTWIYGVASDPKKLKNMRAIHKLRSECIARGECSESDLRIKRFSVALLKNSEHTWGGDVKTILGNYTASNWTNAEFQAVMYFFFFQNLNHHFFFSPY